MGSPGPSKRPIKCRNFSHTCYKVATSARHSTCLLPCMLGIHCLRKGSFLVPRFAAGRQFLQVENQAVSAPANQAVSVSGGRNGNTEQIPQTKSPCRAVQHPQNAGEGTGQVTCTGVPQVSGSKAAYPGTVSWLNAELPRECRRKGRALCHCLWPLTRNLRWFAAGVSLRMSRLGY